MKTCDWCTCEGCGEQRSEDELYLTRCGLSLCSLCCEDHWRQGCDDCAEDERFEAGDFLGDMGRGT